jgi:hypothetical protein
LYAPIATAAIELDGLAKILEREGVTVRYVQIALSISRCTSQSYAEQ